MLQREYDQGYNDGADTTEAKYEPLMHACRYLLEIWAENKNLTVAANLLAAELDKLNPPSDYYSDDDENDDE